MQINIRDEKEQRFLKGISDNFHRGGTNQEAAALFDAIQQAFTMSSDKPVMVHPELVSYLAACSWVALEYNATDRIPWDQGDHDYILTRTVRYFMFTLRDAIQHGRVAIRAGRVLHGCFTIPQWFVSECTNKRIDA